MVSAYIICAHTSSSSHTPGLFSSLTGSSDVCALCTAKSVWENNNAECVTFSVQLSEGSIPVSLLNEIVWHHPICVAIKRPFDCRYSMLRCPTSYSHVWVWILGIFTMSSSYSSSVTQCKWLVLLETSYFFDNYFTSSHPHKIWAVLKQSIECRSETAIYHNTIGG